MSQHDYVIDNQDAASLRADLNNALTAIVGLNSGATEPATTYPYMLWADTANDLLKIRDAADAAWLDVLTLSTGTLDSPQFATINVGHETDTTLTRVSAGVIAVEGATVGLLSKQQSWTKAQSPSEVEITSSGGSIAVDLSLGNHFYHVLTENTTLAAPSNATTGQKFTIEFQQHASAAKTLAFNATYKPVTGTAGVLSTTVGTLNTMTCVVRHDGSIGYGFATYGVA